MLSNCRLDHLKSTRPVGVQACKKRKSETSLVLNAHIGRKDDELTTADINDIKDEFRT